MGDLVWNIDRDFDDENGTPTMWVAEMADGLRLCIEKTLTGEFVLFDENFDIVCRRFNQLTSAKTYVNRKFRGKK